MRQSAGLSARPVESLPDHNVAQHYTTSPTTAFDAALAAIEACGYRLIFANRDQLTITYQPTDISRFHWGFYGVEQCVYVSELPGGGSEVAIADGTTLDNVFSFSRKPIGKIFWQLDKALGAGKLVRGEIIRADPASEAKRFLVIAILMVGAVGIAFLLTQLLGR